MTITKAMIEDLMKECVESMREHQAAFPMPPLLIAIDNWEVGKVRLLLAEGADPNEPDSHAGTRPIQMAVDIECEEALRREEAGGRARPLATLTAILLAAGADPDLPDRSGGTARIWAQQRNHREATTLFEACKRDDHQIGS